MLLCCFGVCYRTYAKKRHDERYSTGSQPQPHSEDSQCYVCYPGTGGEGRWCPYGTCTNKERDRYLIKPQPQPSNRYMCYPGTGGRGGWCSSGGVVPAPEPDDSEEPAWRLVVIDDKPEAWFEIVWPMADDSPPIVYGTPLSSARCCAHYLFRQRIPGADGALAVETEQEQEREQERDGIDPEGGHGRKLWKYNPPIGTILTVGRHQLTVTLSPKPREKPQPRRAESKGLIAAILALGHAFEQAFVERRRIEQQRMLQALTGSRNTRII